jgi:hypothetical protein
MSDRLRAATLGQATATIVLNHVEPAALSIRHALGLNLDLSVAFRDQQGAPVDPTGFFPQLAIMPRSWFGIYGYDMEVTDAVNGIASVKIPGTALIDPAGYNIELYLRRLANPPENPPLPILLAACGVLRLQGSAYFTIGPLGGINVPVVVGPPGPIGPVGPEGPEGPASTVPGPEGPEGERGSIWFTGDDYPLIAIPGPAGLVDGDMYLKTIDPDGGSTWRWSAGTSWTYTGADITGPMGPEGPEGPVGPPGPEVYAPVGATPPATPAIGALWYDTQSQDLKTWNGVGWSVSTANWATGPELWVPNLTDIPGLLFWFDPTDASTMTLDGSGNIQTFRPKIGDPALYTISQANVAQRPDSVPLPNGKTIVRFATTPNQSLANPDVPIDNSQGNSVIFAWKVTDVSVNRGIVNFRPLLGSPLRFDFSTRTAPELTMRCGDGSVLNPRPIAANLWNITTERDAAETWLNGGDLQAATGGPMDAVGSSELMYGRSAMVSPSFAGDLGHLIYIEGPVSDHILHRLEGFVAWDLGIEDRLVPGHPYKDGPPTT